MKVIIIGSGISGLSAASTLVEAGVTEFVILEARDRVGGRIAQGTEFDSPVDLGASWIHGVTDNPLTALAEELKLRLDITHNPNLTGSDSFKIFNSQGLVAPEIEEATRAKYEVLEQKARELIKEEETKCDSLGSLLRMAEGLTGTSFNPMEREILDWIKSGIEGWENTNLDHLSAKYHLLEEDFTMFTGGDGFVIDGYFRIVRHLFNKIGGESKVRLNTPVSNIAYSEYGVTVTTNTGEQIDAEYCICTVPLGVLKSGTLKFEPPLPKKKLEAIDALGFGLMNKIILEFDDPFWDVKSEGFGYVSPLIGEFSFFMNLHLLVGKPILCCFIAADFAREVENWDDETILHRITTVLRQMYGPHVPSPRVHRITRWGSDPYARGSYGYFRKGSFPSDVRNLAASVHRLHFAGESTFKRVGYVHGAFITGQREATKIASFLKSRQHAVQFPQQGQQYPSFISPRM